ncbi:MAG: pentapeptide repeat-containing protein [Clostridiales bacterium]
MIHKRKFFKKKQKKRKYNKFFSYKNDDRKHRNFLYKNFALSNSYNTNFTGSNFSNVNFEKATMKYCGFNGATFENTEFKNANLRGSRFIGAKFKNVLFYNTKLKKTIFKNSLFENVLFVNTSLKGTRGISKDTKGLLIFDSSQVDIDTEVRNALYNALENRYIRSSEVLVFKKNNNLNKANVLRLQHHFSKEELIWGLNRIKGIINKGFYTLSYIIMLIKKELLLNNMC